MTNKSPTDDQIDQLKDWAPHGAIRYVPTKRDPKEILIEYAKMKLDEGDYHAVSDAANDLRVLEAKLK